MCDPMGGSLPSVSWLDYHSIFNLVPSSLHGLALFASVVVVTMTSRRSDVPRGVLMWPPLHTEEKIARATLR